MLWPVRSPTDEHFNQLATRYSSLRASEEYVDPLTDEVARLGRLRGSRVLDVGCGPGTVARQLAQAFDVDAVGVDSSPKMIEAAQREAGGLAEFSVGRAEQLPLDDESVDAVVMRLVVHHLDRPRAFRESFRVLRPSGRLVVTTTDPDAFDTFWMRPYFPSYVGIERRRFPSGVTLRHDLSAAGFTEIRVIPYVMEREFSKATALEKLRGRAYSTFVLMDDEEYEAGCAAAEAGLPDPVRYELRLLNIVGARP